MAQWIYSTVLNLQNILLFYFPFILSILCWGFFFSSPQEADTRGWDYILNEGLNFYAETISRAEILYSFQ